MDSQAPIVPEVPKVEDPERVVSEAEPRVERDNHWVSVLAMAIFVLLALGVVAFLYYQNQQLKSMLATYQTPVVTPTPTATADPTANWKTYINQDLSFKFPSEWSQNKYTITSISPKIKLTVVPKASTLMNECMQATSTQAVGNVFVKKFSRVTTGAMCETSDSSPREIWVIPSASAYSPGFSYEYSATDSAQAELTFDQILSTFKFIGATPSATPSTTGYTCPANGYVDCMPVLTPEKQAACSAEAMAWYKANCPDFKGGAY